MEEKQEKSDYDCHGFRRQFSRNIESLYKTNLIWKDYYPASKNSNINRVRRINGIAKILKRASQLEGYDNITQGKSEKDILEKVDEACEVQISRSSHP